jgi:hypothetical protein
MKIEGRRVDLEQGPVVLGQGDDFTGIWNRSRGGAPIARFPFTQEGAPLPYKNG